jgi:hypothetical protein
LYFPISDLYFLVLQAFFDSKLINYLPLVRRGLHRKLNNYGEYRDIPTQQSELMSLVLLLFSENKNGRSKICKITYCKFFLDTLMPFD